MDQEVDIVERDELHGTVISLVLEVAHNICPRVVLARITLATLAYRLEIFRILRLVQLDHAILREGATKPRRSCRKHTVKHVSSEQGRDHQILSIADTHYVARFIVRQELAAQLDRLPEVLFVLASGHPTNRISGQVSFDHLGAAPDTVLGDNSTLNDAKQVLHVGALVRSDASVKPPNRPFHGLVNSLVRCRRRYYIIQRHHDIGSNSILNLHGPFRRQTELFSIDVRLEGDAVLVDFIERVKRYNLEAAAVCQVVPRPLGVAMQTTKVGQHFLTRLQEEVICICELYITVNERV